MKKGEAACNLLRDSPKGQAGQIAVDKSWVEKSIPPKDGLDISTDEIIEIHNAQFHVEKVMMAIQFSMSPDGNYIVMTTCSLKFFHNPSFIF